MVLSLALSVVTADLAGLRDQSPDGWTREFHVTIAVADQAFWKTQVPNIEQALAFLTTDRWQLRFVEGGIMPAPTRTPTRPDEDCIVLLSGGLDSLVGAIDLTSAGKKPFAISQIVRGDAEKQVNFAQKVGRGLRHLQLNHNAFAPGNEEASQRARSIIFLAYGVLATTTLARYHNGETVPFYVCENGFIALNPPLTGARIGSLSTRTAHPVFLKQVQQILDTAGLRVRIENPYQLTTKGEMLASCADQKSPQSRGLSIDKLQQGRAGWRRSGLCGYRGVRGRAVAWRTGACAQAGDLPAGADQTRVYTEGQRQAQAAGHLDRAGPGLHDSSEAVPKVQLPALRAVCAMSNSPGSFPCIRCC